MGDPKESIRRAALHFHESQHSQTLRQPGSLLQDLNTPEVRTENNPDQSDMILNKKTHADLFLNMHFV